MRENLFISKDTFISLRDKRFEPSTPRLHYVKLYVKKHTKMLLTVLEVTGVGVGSENIIEKY